MLQLLVAAYNFVVILGFLGIQVRLCAGFLHLDFQMNFKAQRAEKGFLQQRFVVVENNIPLEFRLYRKQCSRAVQMYRGERINPEFYRNFRDISFFQAIPLHQGKHFVK